MRGHTIFTVLGEESLTYDCDHDDLVECIVVDKAGGIPRVHRALTMPYAETMGWKDSNLHDIADGAGKNPRIRKLVINHELTAAYRALVLVYNHVQLGYRSFVQNPDYQKLEQVFRDIAAVGVLGSMAADRAYTKYLEAGAKE